MQKIIVVTDRVDLDEQIHKTFENTDIKKQEEQVVEVI